MRSKMDNAWEFRQLVRELLKSMGRDFTKCEQCGKDLKGKRYEIHHTKYEGATIYDLQIICPQCNKAKRNRGLH